ncbi:MAG: head-tail adaptor protein [Betaproteobacteria bacterium]|nr:head-tail adaptor protein [Betaproteobacteria bacterium]
MTVQALTESVGASGFPVETWATLRTEWMGKQDVRGRERLVNGQNAAAFDCRWDVGYSPALDPETVDVTKTRRLVYQGRVYDIVAAVMLGRRDGIELMTLATGKVAE